MHYPFTSLTIVLKRTTLASLALTGKIRSIYWGAVFLTNLGRLKMIRLLAFTVPVLILAASGQAQERPPIFQQMLKTYGVDAFGQIEKMRYTFNIDAPGLNLSRSWEWEPKTDQITYEAKGKDGAPVKVTYQRSQLSSQSDTVKNEIDPAFSNDNYWLLLVLHFSWDGGATITDEGTQKLPMGNGSAQRVVVKYPSEGGYAPGDTWELYVGADNRIQQIVYHGGGPGTQKRPQLLIADWTDYKKAGPLLISTEHRGTADGKPLRIFLSDLSVKVTGSDGWMNAR
jgi:hypothetical protein